MGLAEGKTGIVYTETVVHSPPEQFASDAPYQIAIIELESGGRLTVRIVGKEPVDRVGIGDRVEFVEDRNGIPYYRRGGCQQ
jgi:uncharacterized protein